MAKVVAKYLGDGEFLTGIPARDLEEGDWARLDDARRELVASSSLYEMVKVARSETGHSKEKNGGKS